MSRIWCASVLLVLLSVTAAASRQPAVAALAEARELQKQGRIADALTVLRRAAVTSPRDAVVRNMLGALLNREGEYPEALVHAEAAVTAAPDDHRYRLNRGIVLVEHGRFAEALADFDFALAHNQALLYAYLEKGSALLSLNRDDEARRQWPLARKVDPSVVWPDWYEALDDFIHQRFAAAAAAGFDRVAADQPEFAPADLWRSLARARAGLPAPPITRSGDAWPSQLTRLQRGVVTLDAVLATAEADVKTGDRRRVGEALFVAAEREVVAGRTKSAVELYQRAVAVDAPRHAWKIAAERELARLKPADASPEPPQARSR